MVPAAVSPPTKASVAADADPIRRVAGRIRKGFMFMCVFEKGDQIGSVRQAEIIACVRF
jgi:hypothetical protein